MAFLRNKFRNIFQGPEEILLSEVKGPSTLLDLGCGENSMAAKLDLSVVRTGVDLFEPSIEKSKALGIHHNYVKLNLLEALNHFGPKSFDYVMAIDVIEHFDKDDGWKLLDIMEALARKKTLLLTPNGFVPQGDEENPWQLHRSGWNTKDFTSRGYTVKGLYGLKYLRGSLCEPVIKPRALGHVLSLASEVLLNQNPDLSFHLFAVKRFDT